MSKELLVFERLSSVTFMLLEAINQGGSGTNSVFLGALLLGRADEAS